MDVATASVVVAASICGSFCRAATGFGGSILFILVYSVCNQFHLAPGLESAVLMVLLGSVFEFSTSPVLFLAVSKKAMQLWRNLLLLSVPSLPGTLLGGFLLVQTGEDQGVLDVVKLALNCIFLLVAMFKISMEFRTYAKTRRSSRTLVQEDIMDEDDDKQLCRKLGVQFVLLGFSCGFLNGLMGLPGPLMMVFFTHALEKKRLTASTSFTLCQAFFMITTVLRLSSLTAPEVREELERNWQLALVIPLPALLSLYGGWSARKCINTKVLLQCVLWLLLISSLMGLGVLAGSHEGLWALGVTVVWIGTLALAMFCQTYIFQWWRSTPDLSSEASSRNLAATDGSPSTRVEAARLGLGEPSAV